MFVFSTKGFTRFLAVVVLTVYLGFYAEIFGDDAKIWLEGIFPDQRIWLVHVIAFVATAILIQLTTELGKQIFSPSEQILPASNEFKIYLSGIRDLLKSRYKLRRSQKMAGTHLPVNLNFYATLKGIREQDHSSFIEVDAESATGKILQIFHQAKGRLLLLGEPGAGKTMQLIELGINLMEKHPDSMPTVLNLATWTSDFITLQAWLKKVLPYELGVNASLAIKILSQGRVILLFDGFDEIAPEHSVSFFEKLALYKLEYPHCEFVISSRTDEYLKAATSKAPPIEYQPVEVVPLTLDQIRKKLKMLELSGEQYAHRFLVALDDNPLICKAASIPLYFNCLQTLFTLKPLSEWKFMAKTQENCEAEILN